MAYKKNDSQLLKEGNSKKVTIENVTNGCVVVSMLHCGQRYYGVLIDTTGRQTPYGLLKDEDRVKPGESPSKTSERFQQPLLTRSSYKQVPPQPAMPPARRRSCRIRKQNQKYSKIFYTYTDCSRLYGNQNQDKKPTAGRNCAVSEKRYPETKYLFSERDTLVKSSRSSRGSSSKKHVQRTPRKSSKIKLNKSPRIIIRYRKPGAGVKLFKIPSKICDS